MTGPGGGDFTPDEVRIPLSIDIPPDTPASIQQLSQSIDTVRASMEATSRSAGDFKAHLAELPEIATRVGTAQQNMSQMLERSRGALEGARSGRAPGGAGTSAPPQFVDTFANMVAGTGAGRAPADQASAEAYITQMRQADPRLYANYMSAKGLPVAPDFVAQAARAPTPPAAVPLPPQTVQPGGAPPTSVFQRASTAPENTGASHAPSQQAPSQRSQQASTPEQQAGQQLLSETLRPPGLDPQGYATFGAPRGTAGGPGGGGGGTGAANPGVVGGGDWTSQLPVVGSIIGAATAGYKMFQTMGEQATRMQQMGSVQGGGMKEGFGFEAGIRQMAMSPFITTEQARSIYQTALRSGYTGKEFDTLTDFMADNLTHMNMSVAESTQWTNDVIKKSNLSMVESTKMVREELGNIQSDVRGTRMSAPDARSMIERNTALLMSQGMTQEQASRSAYAAAFTFPNNPALASTASDIQASIAQSPIAARQVMADNGMTGGDVWSGEEEEVMGDQMNSMTMATLRKQALHIKETRERIDGPNNPASIRHQHTQFHRYLRIRMHVDISREDSNKLYDELVGPGGEDVVRRGEQAYDQKPGDAGNYGFPGVGKGGRGLLGTLSPGIGILGGIFSGDTGGGRGILEKLSPAIGVLGGLFGGGGGDREGGGDTGGDEGGGGGDAPGGESAPTPPPSGGGGRWRPVHPSSNRTGPTDSNHPLMDGTDQQPPGMHVTRATPRKDGTQPMSASSQEVRLRLDADPRLLKALGLPESVRLTGNQINAMHGWGRYTMNNPTPGDR